MTHHKAMLSHLDPILPPSSAAAGKFKTLPPPYHRLLRFHNPTRNFTLWAFFILSFLLLYFLCSSSPSASSSSAAAAGKRRSLAAGGNPFSLSKARNSALPCSNSGLTVLVTGAAGFVGTHVATALKRRGDGVVGLDNFNSYYETRLKKARRSLLGKEGVYVVEGDINDAALLRTLFDTVRFTHVVHLAAQAGVRYAMQNPGSYIHSNVNGFVSLLEACKNAEPQPSIVWSSSSSVYGLNSKVPFSENDRTDRPASLYAATKKAGEEIAHAYNHIHGLSITGLRFFTVYGPWGRPDMAYYFFTKDIMRGKEIKIFEGADHATVARDFTYIDDVVKGCLAALDTAEKSTGSGGKKKGDAQLRIYNLGNTTPVPVGKLVSILEKLLKVKAKKKMSPMPRNGDVMFTHANISLASKELGYKPTTDLETGLKKFVKWYLRYNGMKKKSAW